MWNYSDLNTVLKEILPGDNPCKCHRSRYLGYILPATIAGVQGTVQVLVHMHMHPNGCDEYDHLCPSGANPLKKSPTGPNGQQNCRVPPGQVQIKHDLQ